MFVTSPTGLLALGPMLRRQSRTECPRKRLEVGRTKMGPKGGGPRPYFKCSWNTGKNNTKETLARIALICSMTVFGGIMNSFMAGPVSPLISLIASSSPAQHRTSTLALSIATSHGTTTRRSGYYDYIWLLRSQLERSLDMFRIWPYWKQNLRSKPFFLPPKAF